MRLLAKDSTVPTAFSDKLVSMHLSGGLPTRIQCNDGKVEIPLLNWAILLNGIVIANTFLPTTTFKLYACEEKLKIGIFLTTFFFGNK